MSVLGNLIKGFKHITDYTHTHTHIIITEDVGEEVTLHTLLTLNLKSSQNSSVVNHTGQRRTSYEI